MWNRQLNGLPKKFKIIFFLTKYVHRNYEPNRTGTVPQEKRNKQKGGTIALYIPIKVSYGTGTGTVLFNLENKINQDSFDQALNLNL